MLCHARESIGRPVRTHSDEPFTGEERCKFTGLRVYTPSGVPQYRVGSANGHLLLLHLGHIAYCFDLAEKKELWQYNLLGESSRVDANNINYETGPDGETTVTYMSDGFKIRFGRSEYAQLHEACPPPIRSAAEDGAEAGKEPGIGESMYLANLRLSQGSGVPEA